MNDCQAPRSTRNIRKRMRKFNSTLRKPIILLTVLLLKHTVRGWSSGSPVPPTTSRNEISELANIRRIFCISDLHTDNAENFKWLEVQCGCQPNHDSPRNHERTPGPNDLLVIAGDISHDMPTFRKTLRILKNLQCELLFCAGNHEAWLGRRSYGSRTSLEKLDLIYQACRGLGVHTTLQKVSSGSKFPLWVVPLQSWYDGSLSIPGCEDLCADFRRWPWTDFQRCQWPFPLKEDPNARIPDGLNDYFLQTNEASLRQVRESKEAVLTVSHFLPNRQCLPDWKDLSSGIFLREEWLDHGAGHMSAKFAKVAGSIGLDSQIRSLSGEERHVWHVFGHSHRPKDFYYEGIRYIHNPLGKPRERDMHMVSPDVGFQLLWDTATGPVAGPQVLRYWEEQGGGREALFQRLEQRKRKRKTAEK